MKIENTTETIEALADILKAKDLEEISVENEEFSICITSKRPAPFPPMPNMQNMPMQPQTIVQQNNIDSAPAPTAKGRAITSPIVGTYYSSPSPDKAAFIKVGDKVNEGDVVCIVESMKVMNEIQSEISGTVIEICAKSGDAVEFGQNLIIVE